MMWISSTLNLYFTFDVFWREGKFQYKFWYIHKKNVEFYAGINKIKNTTKSNKEDIKIG